MFRRLQHDSGPHPVVTQVDHGFQVQRVRIERQARRQPSKERSDVAPQRNLVVILPQKEVGLTERDPYAKEKRFGESCIGISITPRTKKKRSAMTQLSVVRKTSDARFSSGTSSRERAGSHERTETHHESDHTGGRGIVAWGSNPSEFELDWLLSQIVAASQSAGTATGCSKTVLGLLELKSVVICANLWIDTSSC